MSAQIIAGAARSASKSAPVGSTLSSVKSVPPASSQDLDECIYEIERANILMAWITSARGVLESVQTIAQIHPEFGKTLQSYAVPYNGPDWDSPETQSLEWLAAKQMDALSDMKKIDVQMRSKAV